ncbi:MAG: AMP-binding protein [Bryobacterales bacterium]|nr:AMP-binding protein [Bryobacterales bacterium]MBV9401819.1 AMP-binding protein [Bryobacterales bacterium]
MSSLSYAKGPETPLVKLTLAEALQQTAARFPTDEALVSRHQGLRYTWREFDQAVTHVAHGLAGLGLRTRDRVGIWSTNCAEWILLQYACARAGFVLVNVNPAYRPYELSFVLGKSQMRALFLWENDARSNYQEILEQARKPEHPLEHVIHLGATEWDTILKRSAPLPAERVLSDDPTNIQYTSGTTGSPKGVLLTHQAVLNNGLATGDRMNLTERDRFCVSFPLYHCGGCVCCVLNCVTHGATIILPSATFDPLAVLSAIQKEKATVVAGVPSMFIAQLQHPEFARFDLSTLRAAMIGGAPCPVDLLRRMSSEMHCEEVSVIYGQTEASPVITMHSPGDTLEQRSSTIGKAMPNAEVKIIDSTGATAPLGQVGELCARGYLVMSGYDEDPEATARAIDSDGWLHTGDLAVMREDGHLHIRGRAKDMIIRGGENIYPAEIEAFLFTHPRIAEASVVGLPDLKMGEIVAAWVRPKPGPTLTAEEVRDYCKGKIAHFKIPQHVRIVESLPMTVSGKIQKFRIREIEIEALGLRDQIATTA